MRKVTERLHTKSHQIVTLVYPLCPLVFLAVLARPLPRTQNPDITWSSMTCTWERMQLWYVAYRMAFLIVYPMKLYNMCTYRYKWKKNHKKRNSKCDEMRAKRSCEAENLCQVLVILELIKVSRAMTKTIKIQWADCRWGLMGLTIRTKHLCIIIVSVATEKWLASWHQILYPE